MPRSAGDLPKVTHSSGISGRGQPQVTPSWPCDLDRVVYLFRAIKGTATGAGMIASASGGCCGGAGHCMGSVWTSAEHQGRGPNVFAVITKGGSG